MKEFKIRKNYVVAPKELRMYAYKKMLESYKLQKTIIETILITFKNRTVIEVDLYFDSFVGMCANADEIMDALHLKKANKQMLIEVAQYVGDRSKHNESFWFDSFEERIECLENILEEEKRSKKRIK